MATKDTKTRTSLPVVLEDIAKRELDKPRTRRDIFGLGKKALTTGLGALIDESKVADWIIGDDTISSEMEGLIKDLLIVNTDVFNKMDEINEILPITTRQDWKKISKEMGVDLLEGLDIMSTELWYPSPEEEGWSIAHGVEDDIKQILSGHLHGPITEETRDKLNKVLPITTYLKDTVDKRGDILSDLYDQIQQDYPEIYDIEPDIFYYSDSRASNILLPIQDWVANKTWIGEDEKRLKGVIERGKRIEEEWIPKISDVIKKADKDYPAKIEQRGGYGSVKKKEDETKRRRLIESATDLARRLAAPPTGTQPRKPPVQQPKIPAQSKIPAPRATMEQPTEQGRGLLNLARMLPAVGRRLPFIAPAATLLRSKPLQPEAPIPVTSAFADIDPRAVEGAALDIPRKVGGRVYRNYHDYNPRNI